ncbi:MAG: rhodanese-like domain-containing protein [Methanosarcinaceae archaeon]|nr:rhodanese-like domain-containing protein [Methanosarcinaceae archaeon]
MNRFNKTIAISIFLIMLFAGIGCIGSEDTQGTETTAKLTFTDISVEQAKQMIDNNEVFILDVRTQEEFNAGYIEAATLIPVDELASRLGEVPEDAKILVYCRSGNRSVTASNILINAGYTEVYNMLGGINAWNNAKYPTIT